MFSSSLKELENYKYKIEIVTGLDPTYHFLKDCNFNITYHQNLRKRGAAVKIFFHLFFMKFKYEKIFITAGMTDFKLFLFQFAFIFKKNVSALSCNSYPIFLIHTLKYNFNLHKTINNQHLVFSFLQLSGYNNILPYYLPMENIREVILTDKNSIILHPGNDAINAYRRYPLESYINLILKILNSNSTNQIYIILGPGELDLADEIIKQLRIFVANGKVTLLKSPKFNEIINLFATSMLFITNDSGLAHIAAAFDIRIINIYGPANPSDTSPISKNQIIVKPEIKIECMPCVKIGGKYGCKEQTCLRSIDPEFIYNLI
jgi:ADP-heptose:LPS heptosyltransferase